MGGLYEETSDSIVTGMGDNRGQVQRAVTSVMKSDTTIREADTSVTGAIIGGTHGLGSCLGGLDPFRSGSLAKYSNRKIPAAHPVGLSWLDIKP